MKLRLYIAFIVCSLSAYAQQEPQYTQYMYNMSIVNPGYMINESGIVQVGTLYRTQWVGLDGAPNTANVFAHVPLTDQIELSVNYLNDKIGDPLSLSQNIFNIDAAYKIKLKNDLNMSFGMKLGIDNLSFDAANSNVATDPNFQNTSTTNLAIGAGVFVFKQHYYIGLSSPNLIPSDLSASEQTVFTNKIHLFLIGGYVFDIDDTFKLKPSVVVKEVFGAPLSFDVSANVLYDEKFELGLSYRYQDAVSILAGFNVSSALRIGYAYDFSTSQLNDFNNGSHEFMLLYKFDVLGLSKKYSSPRFY